MYDRMTIFEDHLVRDINAGEPHLFRSLRGILGKGFGRVKCLAHAPWQGPSDLISLEPWMIARVAVCRPLLKEHIPCFGDAWPGR